MSIKKRMKKLTSCCVVLLLLAASCDSRFEEKELYGNYSPIGYKNTCDTISLQADSIYHRRVYDKDKKLVLDMRGKWILEQNTMIHFYYFFTNFDRDLIKYPELLQDTLGESEVLLEKSKHKVQFCVGNYIGENCYQKND